MQEQNKGKGKAKAKNSSSGEESAEAPDYPVTPEEAVRLENERNDNACDRHRA
jgi:hypothetical protein